MRRIFALLLSCFLLISFFSSASIVSALPSLSAESAVLVEAESGKILYEKNAHTPRGMASTTKIMTALVALELCPDPNRLITVSPLAVGIEGSSAYLAAGEQISLLHLLYALLLASANDAAAAIAIGIMGSTEAFADKMNEKAAELGLTQTHFQNPHGLDAPNHYTTAYELALLSAHALKNEQLREIVSTKSIALTSADGKVCRSYQNHNRLLRTDSRVYGVKTGYTRACGRCLVTAAEQDGVALIAVTLNAPDDWNDHRSLFSHGFSMLEQVKIAEIGELSLTIPITGGTKDTLLVQNARALSLTLPKGEHDIRIKLLASQFLYAPITAGQLCGEAVILVDNEEVARLPLLAAEQVEQREAEKLSLLSRLRLWLADVIKWFTSFFSD